VSRPRSGKSSGRGSVQWPVPPLRPNPRPSLAPPLRAVLLTRASRVRPRHECSPELVSGSPCPRRASGLRARRPAGVSLCAPTDPREARVQWSDTWGREFPSVPDAPSSPSELGSAARRLLPQSTGCAASGTGDAKHWESGDSIFANSWRRFRMSISEQGECSKIDTYEQNLGALERGDSERSRVHGASILCFFSKV